MLKPQETVIQLQGIVLASDFDRHGNPMEIVLETENFHQYKISQNKKGRELMNHTFEEVKLEGMIEEGDEIPLLTIQEYSIVS